MEAACMAALEISPARAGAARPDHPRRGHGPRPPGTPTAPSSRSRSSGRGAGARALLLHVQGGAARRGRPRPRARDGGRLAVRRRRHRRPLERIVAALDHTAVRCSSNLSSSASSSTSTSWGSTTPRSGSAAWSCGCTSSTTSRPRCARCWIGSPPRGPATAGPRRGHRRRHRRDRARRAAARGEPRGRLRRAQGHALSLVVTAMSTPARSHRWRACAPCSTAPRWPRPR